LPVGLDKARQPSGDHTSVDGFYPFQQDSNNTSRVDSTDDIRVSIEDSGTGLEAGLSDRIFDPLFTTKPNGMGMGLAICKSIVEGHGGRIWALPRSPNGTVFQLTVPTLYGRA
jgi:signal transduction histidine kinase